MGLEALHSAFIDIVLVLCVAAGCAMVAKLLRLPLLAGYMFAGLLIGPLLGAAQSHSPVIETGQQIAFALLLFVTGLELNWNLVKQHVRTGLAISTLVTLLSFAAGVFFGRYLGLSLGAQMFLGLGLSFTSGIAVIKLLTESQDLSSLHGRLTGSLLFGQDFLAIIGLMLVGGYASRDYLTVADEVFLLLIKGSAVIVAFWIVGTYVLPRIFKWVAQSSELLLLTSLMWCFIGTLTVRMVDFPLEVGALLAGLSLASLPYSFDILAKIRAFRDFFLVILFMNLGATLVLPEAAYLAVTIVLFLAVIFGRPLVAYLILSFSGYRARTAFLTAITQGQLSEFSLIFILIGWRLGIVNDQLASVVGAVTIASMLTATVIFTHRKRLYRFLYPLLRLSERGHHLHREVVHGGIEGMSFKNHVVIFGYHRMGYHILRHLQQIEAQVLVVDFNPEVIERLRAAGVPAVYGDVEDETIFELTHIKAAALIISTIPHREENEYLIKMTSTRNRRATIIVTSKTIENALHYYEKGADYVILPHLLGGEHVGELLARHRLGTLKHFIKHRASELKLLRTKKAPIYFD